MARPPTRQIQDWITAVTPGPIPYVFVDKQGEIVASGKLDEYGRTERAFRKNTDELTAILGTQGPRTRIEHDESDTGCGCETGHDNPDHVHDAPVVDAHDASDETMLAQEAQYAPDVDLAGQEEHLRFMLDAFVSSDPLIAQAIADGEE